MELNTLTITESLAAIERRECSAEEIARACLHRIAAREPEIGAWQWLAPEADLLAQVRSTGAGAALGGALLGVKDTIDTADMPTEYGSSLYAGHRPAKQAVCVARLRGAGGVIAGKTVSTEFGYFAPGKTVNPHDPQRTPGGSSSGSAAAVADGMVPAALGAQTAGSVIRPAAYCGCVGYVASHGEPPMEGVRPLSPSLDSLGMLTRSVADVQLLRTVLVDARHLRTAPEQSTSGPRIALADASAAGPIDDEMQAAVEWFARSLEEAGAEVEPLGLGELLRELTDAHAIVMAVEAARELESESAHAGSLSPQLRELIELGQSTSTDDYRLAEHRIAASREPIDAKLASVDAVVAAAAPGVAPRGRATGSPHASRAWQALGLPAVTLPAVRNADGLPLGVQLIGARHADDALLALAGWAAQQLPRLPTVAQAAARP